MRRYWHVAETFVARISVMVVGLAITLMTARMLGPAGRGTVVQVIVWASTLGVFVNLSLGQLLQRRIQAQVGDWRARTVAPALILFAAMVVVAELGFWSVIGLGLAPAWMSATVTAVSLSLLIPVQAWTEFAFNYFAAIERLRFFNFCLLLNQGALLLLAALYLFVADGRDAAIFLAIYVPGAALLPILTAGTVLKTIAWPGWTAAATELRALLSGAARLHPNTFAAYVLGQGHSLMLSLLAAPTALAVFQLGWQMVNALQVIPASAGLVMYGEIARCTPDEAWRHQRRFVLVLGIAYATICAATGAVLPFMIGLLAGPEFAQSAAIGRWLLPCVAIGALPILLAPQWITRGIFLLASALTTLTAAATLFLDYLLIPRYGMTGPVIVTYMVSVMCILPAQSVFVRHLERRRQSFVLAQGTYAGAAD